MTKCPVCGKGNLRKGSVDESMFGVFLGKFDAEVCGECGESFVDEKAMKKIETEAKEKGVWGLLRSQKVVKSGNSLSVRIPVDLARFIDLTEGESVVLYPDGKKKIIVEIA